MSLALYSALALPLWGAMFALYFILRRAGLKKESLVAKCAGSFLAVGSAGLALWLGGRNPLFHPVFWFFALCTAADALLELRFVCCSSAEPTCVWWRGCGALPRQGG